ncbi:GPX4 [Lepeophtheirus salmonis]|uniref:Glutathione peroxidase n=2 Tax=Lepeophtheirus salmonis TaxID=72036 RepID=A0A7R8H6P6_LEPSM|nr:GPX4 [Lepeophtheirus salmonis]CAF2903337.1 GPX4 [Lepeophtheirus salmonis]
MRLAKKLAENKKNETSFKELDKIEEKNQRCQGEKRRASSPATSDNESKRISSTLSIIDGLFVHGGDHHYELDMLKTVMRLEKNMITLQISVIILANVEKQFLEKGRRMNYRVCQIENAANATVTDLTYCNPFRRLRLCSHLRVLRTGKTECLPVLLHLDKQSINKFFQKRMNHSHGVWIKQIDDDKILMVTNIEQIAPVQCWRKNGTMTKTTLAILQGPNSLIKLLSKISIRQFRKATHLVKMKLLISFLLATASLGSVTSAKINDNIYGFTALDIDGNEDQTFPCNQFGSQEPGTNAEIKEFAATYGVTFDMFSKIDVNGEDAHPLFKYLKSKLTDESGESIKWNFTKFIIDKNGVPVARFSPSQDPIPIVEEEIKKYF